MFLPVFHILDGRITVFHRPVIMSPGPDPKHAKICRQLIKCHFFNIWTHLDPFCGTFGALKNMKKICFFHFFKKLKNLKKLKKLFKTWNLCFIKCHTRTITHGFQDIAINHPLFTLSETCQKVPFFDILELHDFTRYIT